MYLNSTPLFSVAKKIMKCKTKIRFKTKAFIVLFFFVVSVTAGVWFGSGSLPLGTSINDFDGDGIPDWLEIVLGLSPTDFSDGTGDIDNDGIPNNIDKSYGNRLIITIYPIEGERLP